MTYSRERDRWARWMQEHFALDIYAEYWGVDKDSDIDPVDQHRHRLGAMGEFSSRLDYSGIDKIVHKPHGTIQLGQRIRTDHPQFDRDYTIRTSTSNDDLPEFAKLKKAFKDPEMSPPEMYALGVAKEYEIIRDSKEDGYLSAGFSEFYLIYTSKFLSAYHDGRINRVQGGGVNDDGSTFEPFSIDDLYSIEAIAHAWDETDLDQITNRAAIQGDTVATSGIQQRLDVFSAGDSD